MRHSVFALVIVVLLSACSGKTANTITVQGEVSQETYVNMMGGGFGAGELPIAYHVTVHLQNGGADNVLLDEIRGAFVPFQGTPLIMRTLTYDKSKGASPDAYNTGNNKRFTFEPGKPLDFEYTTDGYTRDLLTTAGGQPLQFHVVLLRGKSVVAGPYVADLPSLMNLPQYELTFQGNQKAEPLAFRHK